MNVAEQVGFIKLEGAYYPQDDANAVLQLLMWMQVNARQDQVTLVLAMWHYNALTPAMEESLARAAETSSKRLPEGYKQLVGPVARARRGNTEKVHLFSTPFTR